MHFVKSLTLKFGPNHSEKLTVPNPSITVFVGPNNSGKSLLLHELNYFFKNGRNEVNAKLLDDLEFHSLDPEIASKFLNNCLEESDIQFKESELGSPRKQRLMLRRGGKNIGIGFQQLKDLLGTAHNKQQFCTYVTSNTVLQLHVTNRLKLANKTDLGDLQRPGNALARLFVDDPLRGNVRKALFDTLQKYFVLDPTEVGKVRIRFSEVPPPNSTVERGLGEQSVEFHSKATDISDFGDGVKAYTGIIIEVVAGDPKILLLDEPEAFLHPGLSSQLGEQIAFPTKDSVEKNVFVATHSASFLMGCIKSGAKVNIVRLSYQNGEGNARLLESTILKKMMKDPLMRSIGTINALFYDHVVVVEGDTDRAFYEEINRRLLFEQNSRGIPNCLFLNAQNKQTVKKIVGPLRKLGIPVATIVDVDICKEGGTNWTEFLKSGGIPSGKIQGLLHERSHISKAFKQLNDRNSEGQMPKTGIGIHVLQKEDMQAANELFDALDAYGLFVVRNGELESWLPGLNLGGRKSNWIGEVFEHMGEEPGDSNYLNPEDDDVWEFIDRVGKWLKDNQRKGMDGEF